MLQRKPSRLVFLTTRIAFSVLTVLTISKEMGFPTHGP